MIMMMLMNLIMMMPIRISMCKPGRRGWINCRSDEQSCIYNTHSFLSHKDHHDGDEEDDGEEEGEEDEDDQVYQVFTC